MKKIKLLLVGILLLPFMMLKVHAASAPYTWIVDGETLGAGKSNSAQTASQVTDGTTVTLTLNNYNGGKIELVCYGTGQEGMNFIIELKGDNVINAEDVGIQYSYNGDLTFTGSGKLTVNAPTPALYSDATDKLVIDGNTKFEKPAQEEITSTDTIEKEEEEKNHFGSFILGIVFGLCIVLIVGFLVKKNPAKK